MEFTSNHFLAFAIVFYGVYFFLRAIHCKNQWLNHFISITSFLFYASWYPPVAIIIVYLTILTRIGGIYLYAIENRAKRTKPLALFLIAASLPLVFFKYYNFFFQQVFGLEAWGLDLILPVGISFYTFTVVGCLVDVKRGIVHPSKSISNINFLITFWPHLASGPILRAKNIFFYIRHKSRLSTDRLSLAAVLIMIGVGKKFLIADNIGSYIQWNMKQGIDGMSSMDAILVLVGFTGQIYADFCGYSDMAIGLALLMGIRLPANFNYPYKSTSLTEFWGRWHISLSKWIRDYLYYPLGGNRISALRSYINLMIVFLLSGFWHGASYSFILWGGLNGLGLVLEKIFKKWYFRIHSMIRWIITIFLIISFRAYFMTDFESGTRLLAKTIDWKNVPTETLSNLNLSAIGSTEPYLTYPILIFLGILVFEHVFPAYKVNRVGFPILNKSIPAYLVTASIFLLSLQLIGENLPFIYFQF